MKKLLIAVSGLMALSASAYAADMPLKAPMAPVPAVSWTGCYVDGGAGYGLWNQRHTTTDVAFPPLIEQDDGGRGWLGRVGIGCDYQVAPKWVIGAFGQYDWMGLNGTNSPLEVFGGPGPFVPINATEKERSAWYAGARVGYLLTPSVLTYLEGGFTATRFGAQSLTTNLGVPTGLGYPATTYNGVFLGSGFETALADWLPGLPSGLFLRSDYRFAWYGQKVLGEGSTTTGGLDGNTETTKPYVQTVTTELVWRFNMH